MATGLQKDTAAPPARQRRPRYQDAELTQAVAMTVPAVRLAYVHGWAHGEESGHQVLPVVGLRTRVDQRWYRSHRDTLDIDPSPATMRKAGWYLEGIDPRTEALVICPETGEVAPTSQIECTNTAGRLVACSWPPEQDPERLAPIVDQVVAEAREKDSTSRQRRGVADA